MLYRNVDEFIKKHLNRKKQYFVYSNHTKYIRIACGYDIETTRIEKHSFMYHWQLSWGEDELLCRKWDDFYTLIAALNEWLEPKNAVIIVWVANLGYEFSFLCRRFYWKKIFARESRNPLTARTGRIEFRECLSISGGGGLANLAKNYCKTRKLKGDLDFNVLRNSQTVLQPDTEEQYTINDVRILSEWAEYIYTEFSDTGKDIPLTATSIVRNDIRAAAESTGEIERIRAAVYKLYPPRQTYNKIMQYLFRGGYTHANVWYSMVKWDNTIGVDYTSDYPACMLQCYYPMTEFVQCSCSTNGVYITDNKIREKCMVIVCDIYNIERSTYHAIESENKLIRYENARFDNGRLYAADRIRVALTELDYQVYCMFYKWSALVIVDSMCAERGKLPQYLLKPLKHYYYVKQQLKARGLDYTIEYRNAKARLNSFYGCCVTRLNFTEHIYNQDTGEWEERESRKTYEKMIEKQLLSPYWGIWITSHARQRLLRIVHTMDIDKSENNVIYCDTDSIYFDDTPRNRRIIAEYNARIAKYNAENLPPEFSDIGLFDWVDKDKKTKEPVRYEFLTLGAKRYLKFYDNHAEVVVAGMRKGTYEHNICRPFADTDDCYPLIVKDTDELGNEIKRRAGYVSKSELFELFSDNYILSCDESEKLASIYDTNPSERGADGKTYEDEYTAEVTDEQGHTEIMREKSGVCLYPIPFTLKMSDKYLSLIKSIIDERRKPCRM